MPASVLRFVASLALAATVLAGCTTARAPVDTTTLTGWTSLGNGIYLCEPPACPTLRLAGYDVVSLGRVGQTIFDSDNEQTRKAFENALRQEFDRRTSGDRRRLQIDGPLGRTMVGANESIAFDIVGTDRTGGSPDPGYAILIPNEGVFHMVFAFSDSKSAARATARQFVNAISL